jgi:ABC-2 type transport system permease protein
VTPVTPAQFILAYTLAAMIRSAGRVAVWGFRSSSPSCRANPPAAIGMAALASFLRPVRPDRRHSFQQLRFPLDVLNFILLPLIYLGGVFYPISILPPLWAGLSHLNPLFYLIDGFRHAILGVGDLPLTTAFGIGVLLALGLFGWAALLIGKGYRLRS